MEDTRDLSIGQVVKSKAGRDKGKVFLIVEIPDEKFVKICDGEIRKVSKPKLKKIRHLIIYSKIFSEVAEHINKNEKMNNAYIRKLLEPYKLKTKEKGGT